MKITKVLGCFEVWGSVAALQLGLMGCSSAALDAPTDTDAPAVLPSSDETAEHAAEYSVGSDHAARKTARQAVRGVVTAEELALHAARKPNGGVGGPVLASTPTQETLRWVKSKAAEEQVMFTLMLKEHEFGWHRLKGLHDTARAALIAERTHQVDESQLPLVSRLEALGATVVKRRWLINAVDVRAPAGLAAELAALPEVEQLEHDAPIIPLGTANDGFYGNDRRKFIKADRFISKGYTGYTGGQGSNSRVLVANVNLATDKTGTIDNKVAVNHPGFLTKYANATYSRVIRDDWCSPNVFICSSGGDPKTQTHDQVVMGVLAGSIEMGQDARYTGTNTSAQIDRSGISSGAYLEYFQAGDNSITAAAFAFQDAVASGPDIINNSWGMVPNFGSTVVDSSWDYAGFNTMIRNAFNAGILVVWAAGNNNPYTIQPTTSCNQNYPSNRPEVLTVNGLWSVYDSSGAVPATPTIMPWNSSASACNIGVIGSNGTYYTQPDNSIGVDAPAAVGKTYYWNSASDNGYAGTLTGTSFAAPIVAGAAALLKDARYELGMPQLATAPYMKADLLMLTDGYSFSSNTDGTTRAPGGTSPISGMGRLKLRIPGSAGFSSTNWSWHTSFDQVGPGDSVSWTVPANIKHYRQASYWTEADLGHSADIDFHIDALDANGNVCASWIASQTDYSLINGFHIERSEIPACALTNGKLKITEAVYGMPAGQKRTVYTSYLYDNESGY